MNSNLLLLNKMLYTHFSRIEKKTCFNKSKWQNILEFYVCILLILMFCSLDVGCTFRLLNHTKRKLPRVWSRYVKIPYFEVYAQKKSTERTRLLITQLNRCSNCVRRRTFIAFATQVLICLGNPGKLHFNLNVQLKLRCIWNQI